MSISIAHLATLTEPQREPGTACTALCRDVRRKILLALLCMSILAGGLGAYAVSSIAATGALADQAIEGALVSIGYARAVSVDFNALEAATARSRMLPHKADLRSRLARLSNALDESLATVAQRASTPQDMQAAVDARIAIADWRSAAGPGVAEDSDEPRTEALARLANRKLERLINHAAGNGLEFQEHARAMMGQAKWRLSLGTCAALALGGLIAVLLARAISRSIGGTRDAGGRVAAGWLDR